MSNTNIVSTYVELEAKNPSTTYADGRITDANRFLTAHLEHSIDLDIKVQVDLGKDLDIHFWTIQIVVKIVSGA